MTNEYYVIVNSDNLTYMKNGDSANIDEADKFKTIEEAKEELKDYDEDFNGAIYRVIEYKSINLEKVERLIMTNEQREAIEYLKESVLIYKNTIPKISEAIDTVLSMLKEKDKEIEKLEKENELAKEQLKKQCEIADERNNLLVKVNRLESQIDLMANYIVNLIKYNNPEEIREVEELKQYFERKSEK